MYRKKFNKNSLKTGALIAVFSVATLGAVGGQGIYQAVTKEKGVRFTVLDKERITVGSGNDRKSKYTVSTEDSNGKIEVFQNTDAYWQWKFNSSDIQAKMKRDSTYEAEVTGIRIGFLSFYRNIVDIKKVDVKGTKIDNPKTFFPGQK